MLSTASSSRVLTLTRTTSHGGKARRDHRSDDESRIELDRKFSSEMDLARRWRRVSGVASCGGVAGCASGDGGLPHAGIRHDDNESSATSAITSGFPLVSLLTIRGGASSSPHRGDNAVQGIIKSILASPSLPSPIKRLIEMICGYIETLTDWRVLPQVEVGRKSKSKKTKPRERSLVAGTRVGVGGATTPKKRAGAEGAEDDSVEVDTTVLVRKRRRRKQKAGSAFLVEPRTREEPMTKEDPATAAGAETTDASMNHPTTSPPPADAASKKFLSSSLKSSNPNYRIQRELKEFLSSPPPGLSVKISGKNVRLWIVTLTMPSNTIYAGETYKLRIQFPADYPTSPPSVFFLPPTPRHEHVYTNGDICLSLLGSDWRPIMTAQSVAQAIMSILCGAQRKSLPMDNARHAGNKPGKKQDDWVYHDDNC
jgi:ubiquitin-conjugating enzyme E2 W